MKKIGFDDLSLPLKVLVVFGYFIMSIYLFFIVLGFIEGFFMG